MRQPDLSFIPKAPQRKRPWSCVRLILGDQLNASHPWFREQNPDVLYVMMEVRCESEYVTHHIQKIAGIFATMRGFAQALHSSGHEVHYISITDPSNAHNFADNLIAIKRTPGFDCLEYQLPDEYRLDLELKKLSPRLDCTCQATDTDHFLTSREEVGLFFEGKKVWRMENFYRSMRQRYGILLDRDGKPLGGQWNFDQENRKKIPKSHEIPGPLNFSNDVTVVLRDIYEADLPYIGNIDAENFIWPISRQQARQLLQDFLQLRLKNFGRFQDALSEAGWSLYHSRISQALNLKLISPQEVIQQALSHWESQKDAISLPQIEGFVRQILGWREYVRGIYWAHMPRYAQSNALDHQRPLPDFFWTGQTKMRCMQKAIKQSLEYGYAHHIQRLMVTGNFCALAGITPAQVDQWYLGIYVDAFEWVELPNTRGMSQFADAGKLASKPYVSSANYLQKMGDHCSNCHYQPKQKLGDQACPFNSLYWRFLHVHESRLRRNPRMAMMYRQLDKLKDKEQVLAHAEQLLERIETL